MHGKEMGRSPLKVKGGVEVEGMGRGEVEEQLTWRRGGGGGEAGEM